MVDGFQKAALESRLGIPIIYGIDAVHGNNSVYGATIFPHNIGLGATRSISFFILKHPLVIIAVWRMKIVKETEETLSLYTFILY